MRMAEIKKTKQQELPRMLNTWNSHTAAGGNGKSLAYLESSLTLFTKNKDTIPCDPARYGSHICDLGIYQSKICNLCVPGDMYKEVF